MTDTAQTVSGSMPADLRDAPAGPAVDTARAERLAHEHRNLFSRLPAIYAASRTQGQDLLRRCGLSIVEWRTLWDLHEVGPLTIRQLAEIQRADHSLISRALPEMRRKGYVTMERDASDGRAMRVALTEVGRAAYHRAAPIMAQRRQALRNEFSEPELDMLIALLDRLETFLRQPTDDLIDQKDTR